MLCFYICYCPKNVVTRKYKFNIRPVKAVNNNCFFGGAQAGNTTSIYYHLLS